MSNKIEYVEVSVADLTREQLHYLLNVTYQIPDIAADESMDALHAHLLRITGPISKIKAPDLSGDIPVSAESYTPAPPPFAKSTKQTSRNDPKVTINISLQPEQGGDRPVEVGVNGSMMMLPRGEDIDVPLRYVIALKNAKTTQYSRNPQTGDLTAGDVQLHPFNVVKGGEHLTKEGILRWSQSQDMQAA